MTYFLIGSIRKQKASKPHNTIINNFDNYETEEAAVAKANQLLTDDPNLNSVTICQTTQTVERG